ncbi:MAG: decaprenyl-phosphate phosphoribosyltransferase [Dehalococcoidia bacterium]|nr:decaprenyl-phosphate phosphoribosyltransferase [Dehalococcoidia bacterium]
MSSKETVERAPVLAGKISALDVLREIFLSMRPRQWTKNLIILLPLPFTVNQSWYLSEFLTIGRMALNSVAAVAVFCMLSGSIYLINDLTDIEKDRQHPHKRRRPLASGRLGRAPALVAVGVLLAVSLPASFLLNWIFGVVALVYFAIMVSYSFVLKHIVLVDVLTISVGFVLRAVAGAVAIKVPISPWLYVCTIMLALFLGLGKRRHELILLEGAAGQHRQILEEYSAELLEQLMVLVGAATVMAYSLYTFSAENVPKNYAMMLTIPYVLYGIFRYLYLVHIKDEGGSPEELLMRDRPIMISIALWLLSSAVILLFFR